jgi:hypothetical protein
MKLAATGAISLLRSTKTHHVVVRMRISSLNCVPGSNIRPIDAGGLMVTKKQMQEGWNDDESAWVWVNEPFLQQIRCASTV